MCGRYANDVTQEELVDAFAIAVLADDARLLPPSWNVAPTQQAVIVTQDDARRADTARWGLVPSWAKDPAIGSRMINARSETVAEKPSFRASFASRRCLVPASGYYEWRRDGAARTPLFIYDSTRAPLAFAGLWDNGTFTILTAEARGLMSDIHHRQPVILQADAREVWLDPSTSPTDLHAVIGAPAPPLAWHEVTAAVGNVRNNTADLVEPATPDAQQP